MNKLNYYLKYLYRLDKFSRCLLAIGLIFLLTRFTMIAGILLIAYAIWRSVSKNKNKRYQELQAFENSIAMSRQMIYRFKMKISDSMNYKIFKCPKCSQKLRVPRKKGKLTVTCKKCSTKFKGRT